MLPSYSSITTKPTLSWPGGARLAVVVVVNVEHYEFLPPPNKYKNPYPGVERHPDIVSYAYRDYGNRVGLWRMLEVLDACPAMITASLNTEVLRLYPEVRHAMVERSWSFMSHGTYNTRYLYGMGEEEERAFYRSTIDTVKAYTGETMRGMLGPSFTASENTLRLMSEAGMTYTMDWFIDDQPFTLVGGDSQYEIVGVPYSRELNDAFVMPGAPFYAFEGDYFEQICRDQFDVLYAEGAASPRVMTIALHPYYLGLPHQVAYLDNVLRYIAGHDSLWWTTPEQIAAHYLREDG